MLLKLFISSSIFAKRSSQPLINLHLFWYLASSSSNAFQNSLMSRSIFSKTYSPVATVRISLIAFSFLIKSEAQRWPMLSSVKLTVIFSLSNNFFQCLGLTASLFNSRMIRFIFLRFCRRFFIASKASYCLRRLGKAFNCSIASSSVDLSFFATTPDNGVSFRASMPAQTRFSSVQTPFRPWTSSSRISMRWMLPGSSPKSSLALQILV
mmetsp:Transcript_53150/g.61030  ORF Transcript_53150/g.61030 Transcript_53150/m.61030 type:complete len:209 (+) Transcript_53150:742-1368(+)